MEVIIGPYANDFAVGHHSKQIGIGKKRQEEGGFGLCAGSSELLNNNFTSRRKVFFMAVR
jgi:hypothetical protein